MKKNLTAHLTAGLLSLFIFISAAAGTVMAAENAITAPGFIGEKGERGDLPSVAQSRADLACSLAGTVGSVKMNAGLWSDL